MITNGCLHWANLALPSPGWICSGAGGGGESTASNASMLCSVSRGLCSIAAQCFIKHCGRTPPLPVPGLWYSRRGLDQLKCLLVLEKFAPRTFSCKRDAKESTARVTYSGMDRLVTGPFVFPRQLEPRPEPLRFSGAFIGCLNPIVQGARSDQN